MKHSEIRCSIILITYNQSSKTKKCLESIFNGGIEEDDEIIIIDNSSKDETKELLADIDDYRVTVLYNTINLGFAKAVNQGIYHSRGKYICLLNNDTIVRRGFIDNLIKGIENTRYGGIIGPYSKGMYPPMYLEKESDLDGIVREIPIIYGYCILFKKSLVKQIGGFDEIYEIGNFEDLDFAERVKRIGKKLLVDGNTYIDHYHHASWKPKQLDLSLKRNYFRFKRKWGFDDNYFENFVLNTQRVEKSTVIYLVEKKYKEDFLYIFEDEIGKVDNGRDIIIVDDTRFNQSISKLILKERSKRRITHIRTCSNESLTIKDLCRIGLNNSFSKNNIIKRSGVGNEWEQICSFY